MVCVALLLSIRRKLRPSGGIQQSTQKGFPSSLAIGGRGRVYSSLFLLIYMYKFCLTIEIEMIKSGIALISISLAVSGQNVNHGEEMHF